MIDTLRKCLYLLPHSSRRDYLLLLPLSLLSGLAEMGAVAGIYALLMVLTNPVEGLATDWAVTITQYLPWKGQNAIILQLTALLALYYIARSIVVLFAQYFRIRVSQTATAGLSCSLLHRYLAADYPFHFGRHSSDLIRNCTDGAAQSLGVLFFIAGVVTDFLMALGMVAILIATSPTLALFVGVGLLAVLLLILRLTKGMAARYGEGRHEMSAALLRSLQQALGAVKEVKVLGRERFFYDDYAEQQRRALQVKYIGVTLESMPSVVLQAVLVCGALGLVAVLTVTGQTGVQSLPIAAVFGYVGIRILPMASGVLNTINHIRGSSASVDALYDDFIALRSTESPPDGPHIEFKSAIVLEGVTYRYPSGTQPAISDLSLTIRRGESIGIIGQTGAGKSTLVDVILGLLPPTRGRITVDGADLSQTSTPWKRRVGYVPQTTFLIDDTLRRNIALGIVDGEIDPARLREVLVATQLDQFVATLPQRLETLVGESGVRLSGGERQRIAIARALYHDPDLLIFDEATASLDVRTESEITRTINALRDVKTVIVIAHRLSSVHACDRVVWLSHGRIVDVGSFRELLERHEDFQALVDLAAV